MIKHHIPDEFTPVPYRRFAVGVHCEREIYGGVPNKEDLLKSWYSTKTGEREDVISTGIDKENPEAGTVEEVATELDLDETVSQAINVFRRDKEGKYFQDALYLASHQLKAMCKQSASLLKITTNKRGSKQTLAEGMTLHGKVTVPGRTKVFDDKPAEAAARLTNEKVFFQQDRAQKTPVIIEATGTQEFTGHISGPQGTRSIIKMCEYVMPCYLQFEIHLLDVRMGDHANAKDITPQNLYEICSHAQKVGVGSNRSFDSGQFTLVHFEEITDDTPTPVYKAQRSDESEQK